jgi:hypothetical protein
MQGDFSQLNFDPRENERGVVMRVRGVLRNMSGVLHQQGRVTTDADVTESELLQLEWRGQAGRDIIGANVCAVPSTEPQQPDAEIHESALGSIGAAQSGLDQARRMLKGVQGLFGDFEYHRVARVVADLIGRRQPIR